MTTRPLTREEMAAKLRQENPTFVEYAETVPEIAERYLDACMAEQERDIREPWRTLTFDRTTEAKGRNGYFTLDHGGILVSGPPHPRGWLELWAKRHGDNAPILLQFHQPGDMRLLGAMLTKAAQHWDALVAQEATP